MHSRLLDAFCHAMSEPRVQELVTRFYEVRGAVHVRNAVVLRTAAERLLDAVADAVAARATLAALEALERNAAPPSPPAAVEAALRGARGLALGPAFDDTVAVLYVCGEVIGEEAAAGPDTVLARVDDMLALLCLSSDVSVVRLWEELTVDARDVLWIAVTDLLRAVAQQCHLEEDP